MGLEVLRHYNVLYNEAKESKNKSNTCFFRHPLLPCSYLLGCPAVDVVSLPVSSGTGPSPPGRRKGRAVHWASMPRTSCRQGSSTHLRTAQAAPALLNQAQPCLQPKKLPHYLQRRNKWLPSHSCPAKKSW